MAQRIRLYRPRRRRARSSTQSAAWWSRVTPASACALTCLALSFFIVLSLLFAHIEIDEDHHDLIFHLSQEAGSTSRQISPSKPLQTRHQDSASTPPSESPQPPEGEAFEVGDSGRIAQEGGDAPRETSALRGLPAPASDAAAAPRPAKQGNCAEFATEEGTDMPGSDLGSDHVQSVDACCALCAKEGAACKVRRARAHPSHRCGRMMRCHPAAAPLPSPIPPIPRASCSSTTADTAGSRRRRWRQPSARREPLRGSGAAPSRPRGLRTRRCHRRRHRHRQRQRPLVRAELSPGPATRATRAVPSPRRAGPPVAAVRRAHHGQSKGARRDLNRPAPRPPTAVSAPWLERYGHVEPSACFPPADRDYSAMPIMVVAEGSGSYTPQPTPVKGCSLPCMFTRKAPSDGSLVDAFMGVIPGGCTRPAPLPTARCRPSCL